MERRAIGKSFVTPVGLGAMPMSTRPGRNDERSVHAIQTALDAGVGLIDTADAYSHAASDMGHNERLVARALRERNGGRDAVIVATKGGHVRTDHGGWLVNGRAAYLRAACTRSLRNLGVDCIDLYQLHRPDPLVPFAESVGALRDLAGEGKIRMVGVSNVTTSQIDIARRIVDVASVQNQFAPGFVSSDDEVRACERMGIAFLAWGTLGGVGNVDGLVHRFPAFRSVAQALSVSVARVVVAWLLARSPAIIPLVGASRPETILDSLAAVTLRMTDADVAALDAATGKAPCAG
jgi:aryl-alcohol dehydrogenase-like predicted oxidoreductase